mgnify:CR=1 FL=1
MLVLDQSLIYSTPLHHPPRSRKPPLRTWSWLQHSPQTRTGRPTQSCFLSKCPYRRRAPRYPWTRRSNRHLTGTGWKAPPLLEEASRSATCHRMGDSCLLRLGYLGIELEQSDEPDWTGSHIYLFFNKNNDKSRVSLSMRWVMSHFKINWEGNRWSCYM